MLLWFEDREAHPDGCGYSQFCERCQRWERTLDLPMRQEHKAGEKGFVDFPGMTIPSFDPDTGEKTCDAELFVAVLGASNCVYAEALASQELRGEGGDAARRMINAVRSVAGTGASTRSRVGSDEESPAHPLRDRRGEPSPRLVALLVMPLRVVDADPLPHHARDGLPGMLGPRAEAG